MTKVQMAIKQELGCSDRTCLHHDEQAADIEAVVLEQQKRDRERNAIDALDRLSAKREGRA
jgi:hypothetical protein